MTAKTKSTSANGAPKSAERPAGTPAPAEQSIQLTPLQQPSYEIPVKGISPLIVHKWDEKSLQMMRDKQAGKKSRKKLEPKIPEEAAEAALYRLKDGRPGMPATAFKGAIAGASRLFEGLTLVETKQLIFVEGEGSEQLVPITGDYYVREDTPRIAMGTADLRYRPCFPEWSTVLTVTFVANKIDLESVLALVDAAGLGGVGEWRPSAPKSLTGTFGRFKVDLDSDAQVKQIR